MPQIQGIVGEGSEKYGALPQLKFKLSGSTTIYCLVFRIIWQTVFQYLQ